MKNLDKVLDLASTKLPAAGVDCLLIGGFAVNHYGYELIRRQIEALQEL